MGLFDKVKAFGSNTTSGKLPGNPAIAKGVKSLMNIFSRDKIASTDYNENNYDLFRSIYHNSTVNGVGEEYAIASALGKPIIDIAAGFVAGRGLTVELENLENDKIISDVEAEVNSWLDDNGRLLFNLTKHSYRDGDSYVHIDEFGRLTELDASGVTEIIDPITGSTVGFDVKRDVSMIDSSDLVGTTTEDWVYVKQYRTDSIRIYRYLKDSPQTVEIIWEKVFTVNGAIDIPRDEEGNSVGVDVASIQERRIAVRAFHNEPEAESVYGNSDYQNILAVLRNYSDLIKSATRGAKYNAVPTPVIMGLQNAEKTQQAAEYKDKEGRHLSAAAASLDNETSEIYGSTGKNNKEGIEWSQDKVLYLSKGADAKFITGNGFMEDLGKLLEYYFYLFVQGSETPEYVLGTAVSSSKASTETQSPVFEKKIERKQMELADFVKDIVTTMIERRALMSDPMYQRVQQFAPKITVSFPPLDNEDMKILFETVQWAYESKLMTGEKVLMLLLGDRIKDIPEELKNAANEAKKRAEEEPANSDRIVKDLMTQAKIKDLKTAEEQPVVVKSPPVEK